MSTVYLNGKYTSSDLAFIPIHDRGFLFGDGVFTTLRVQDGIPQHIDRHIERLQSQCRQLNIIAPQISPTIFHELIALNYAQKGIWRMKVMITRAGDSSLHLPERKAGTILITLDPYLSENKPALYLSIYPFPLHTQFSRVKTLSYLDRLAVKQYAMNQNTDDAIVCNENGEVLESSFSNLYWIHENILFTPAFTSPLFKGITLSEIIETSDIPVKECMCRPEEIPSEAKIFLCNSLTGSVPVKKIKAG